MAIQTRGGIPTPRQLTVASDGTINGAPNTDFHKKYVLPAVAVHLDIQTDNPLRVYFLEEDAKADVNFIHVTDSWSGTVNVRSLWFKADAASANIQLVPVLKG